VRAEATSRMAAGRCRTLSLLPLLGLLLLSPAPVSALEDALKAAEISRWIREHFRSSGMNWVSPKMLQARQDGLSDGLCFGTLCPLLAPFGPFGPFGGAWKLKQVASS
jgi:hypothetical protein